MATAPAGGSTAPTPQTSELCVPSQAGRLAEAYEVGKAVGKGGYAVVYKGVRREDGRIIAVKKVEIFEMTQKKRERCLQEVTLLQQLTHPFIIQMLDAFIDENMLIIIFEWAPAGDLKRLIKKTAEAGKKFDETAIWTFFSQITDALRYMHQHRIMHRDIKPANVLVGANGALKIGDLGLGRQLSEHTMEAFSKVGTPYYVSPEVVRGAGYDWKSDVWSLGCLLYELACLHSPFEMEGANLYDVFQKISKGDYQPLPADQFSAPLRSLVVRMLSVDPAQRPELEEVWGITQQVMTQTQTKARQDVHSAAEELHQHLTLLEADVAHKLARQNGKRVELPPPPADVLRTLHPLFFAEPLAPLAAANASAEQKRQLGAFMAVFAWLLRLAGRPELATQVDGQLEAVPAPPGIARRGGGGAAAAGAPSTPPLGASRGPKPPSVKRSDSGGNASQRVRVSRWGATADAPGAAGGAPTLPPGGAAAAGPAGVSPRAQSPASPLRSKSSKDMGAQPPPSSSSAVCVPSCSNLLKGAEVVKKAAQAVGLSTEFAPVSAVATGHGRAVCAMLQDMADVAWAKVAPAVRKPRYHEDASVDESQEPEDETAGGFVDDDDEALVGARPSSRGIGAAAEDDEEAAAAYFEHDAIVGAVKRADPSSRGRGSGISGGGGSGGAAGRGSGPGRPAEEQARQYRHQVDPAAWRLELERLGPTLGRITLPAGAAGSELWGDWHRRWGDFKAGAATVLALSPDAASALSKAGGAVAADLERVGAAERRVNGGAGAAPLLARYKDARRRLADAQRVLVSAEELQQAGNAALSELGARLGEVATQVQERAGGLDGGGAIAGIQAGMAHLKKELLHMDLRLGVVQQQLLARQRRRLAGKYSALDDEDSQELV